MKNLLIRTVRTMAIIAGLVIPGVLFFLMYLSITEYLPAETEKIENKGKAASFPKEQVEFTFLSWNIGYGGQGKDMDFFYEGGERVRPEKEEFYTCLKGIQATLGKFDTLDFILLQELDIDSKRSYFTDEIKVIDRLFGEYSYAFAKNYDCRFIPIPPLDPIGRVVAGLALFSKYEPLNVERDAYTANFSWPKRLVFLKRCFMVMRFPVGNNKEFVIINTHNSTFDKGGALKKSEFARLNAFMTSEFRKGNYVVAGGDWNNNPRGFLPGLINSGDPARTIDTPIDAGFLPGWEFVFDSSLPSNRDVDTPYIKGKTKTTIIDFFVVSPNVKVKLIRTISAGFEYSDHNPILMKAELINSKGAKEQSGEKTTIR